jgi:hypothetical protein
VVSRVRYRNLVNEEPRWGLSRQKQTNKQRIQANNSNNSQFLSTSICGFSVHTHRSYLCQISVNKDTNIPAYFEGKYVLMSMTLLWHRTTFHGKMKVRIVTSLKTDWQ